MTEAEAARDGAESGRHSWLVRYGGPHDAAPSGLRAHPLPPLSDLAGRTLTVLTPDGQAPPEVFVGATHAIVVDGDLFDREALERADPDARGAAELVLRRFLREDARAFAKLRGTFAAVIWDRAADSIVCAHDALGSFPVFYAHVGDELLVSPSQDMLVRQARVPKTLNATVLAEWVLDTGSDVGDTFFQSIRRLPPAHQLRFDRGVGIERYWHPEDDPPSIPSDGVDVHAVFDQLLIQAVDRSLRLPHPGIFLSGGIDSGVVAAVAAERTRARQTFTPVALSAAFPDPQANEVATQRAVAAAVGIDIVVLPVEDSGPDGILVPILQNAGESHLPTTGPWEPVYERLAAVARERGCRSVLTGDGGNEFLEARWELAADLIRRGDIKTLRTLYRLGRSYYGGSRRSMLRRLAWQSGTRIVVRDGLSSALGRATPQLLGAWYRNRYGRVIHTGLLPDSELRRRVVDRMVEAHPTPGRGGYPALRRRVYDDPATPLALEASFAWGKKVGLETHAPLLDVDLIRFLYHVPPELLSFGGRAKGLAQASLDQRIDTYRLPPGRAASPETFFRRVMLAEGERAFAMLGGTPILSGLGIIDEGALGAALKSGYAPGNLGYSELWNVLSLEAWLRARA